MSEKENAYMKAFPKFVTLSEQTRLDVLKMILAKEEYEEVVELYEKEEAVRKAYADPSPATFREAYAEALEKSKAPENSEDNRTTLGLQGFKQRELHTVMWALREFADAAGIEIYNGIKERYDAERKTYGISLRFYKK